MGTAAFGINVPGGDPAALEGAASDLRASSGSFERVASTLTDSSTAGWWTGVASLQFTDRCVSHSGAIASGAEVMALAAEVCDRLSEALAKAKKAAETALDEAKRADERRETFATELRDAQSQASDARYAAMEIDRTSAMAALMGLPSPGADAARDQKTREADAANRRAEAAQRARDRAQDELQDAQRAGNRAEREYEEECEAAAAKLGALVGLLPRAIPPTSLPAAFTGGPGAPAPVAPIAPRGAGGATADEEDDGNIFDGLGKAWGDVTNEVGGLATGAFNHVNVFGDEFGDTWKNDWEIAQGVASDPLGAGGAMIGGIFAPLSDSYEKGGIDEAIGRSPSVLAGIVGGKGITKLKDLDAPKEPPVRPDWKQSERDAAERYGDQYETQRSYKDGKEVPWGTKGSSRPDLYQPGTSIEVKNYDVTNSGGRSNLVRSVIAQAETRLQSLPEGTVQRVVVDVRGQNVAPEVVDDLAQRIGERSNGAISPSDVVFFR